MIVFFPDGSNVTFQMPSEFLVTTKQPLKRFASPAEVAETVAEEVPNIFPIKPTLDLDKLEEKPFSTRECPQLFIYF